MGAKGQKTLDSCDVFLGTEWSVNLKRKHKGKVSTSQVRDGPSDGWWETKVGRMGGGPTETAGP